jgi:DNA repair exonuclease SbcCD nuclease subunit
MVKFLHTADLQLGMKASSLGSAAEVARNARFETIARLLDLARQREVDFILIAGDTFENNGVSEEVLSRACDALSHSKGIPIFILPGNHDPLSPDSVYRRRSWLRLVPSNVTVIDKAESIRTVRGDAVLYPCPLKQKLSRSDPTAWIAKEDIGMVRIGVAHGSLDIGLAGDRPPFPIAPNRASTAGLDYLALGDWHSFLVHSDRRTVYPGTPEPTAFGERDSGHAVIVNIDKSCEAPEIECIDTAVLDWLELQEEVSTSEDIDRIVARLSSVKTPARTIARVILKGMVPIDLKERAAAIKAPELAFLRIEDANLYLRPDEASLLPEMPGRIAQETMRSLLLLLSRHPAHKTNLVMTSEQMEDRLRALDTVVGTKDTSPEVLEKAIEHLYLLSREVNR